MVNNLNINAPSFTPFNVYAEEFIPNESKSVGENIEEKLASLQNNVNNGIVNKIPVFTFSFARKEEEDGKCEFNELDCEFIAELRVENILSNIPINKIAKFFSRYCDVEFCVRKSDGNIDVGIKVDKREKNIMRRIIEETNGAYFLGSEIIVSLIK
jgi:hypothetical protein